MSRTPGELMFEGYLGEHSYPEPAYEPDLGSVKRPDYLVTRGDDRCIVEVKEFAADTRSFPDRPFGSTDLATILKPVRLQIRAAARQLKDVAEHGLPLVVALTNPHGAFVIMGHNEVVWAMYGDPVVRMDISRETGSAVGEPQSGVGRNGRLARDHQYISAVIVVGRRERSVDWHEEMRTRHADLGPEKWEVITAAIDAGEMPEGSYHRADVYRTLGPDAVPLPPTLFDGPGDRVFEPNEDGTAYLQVRP